MDTETIYKILKDNKSFIGNDLYHKELSHLIRMILKQDTRIKRNEVKFDTINNCFLVKLWILDNIELLIVNSLEELQETLKLRFLF